MSFEERLIEEVLASSGIVSARRRGEVARELRAHLEDAIEEARAAGLGEAEIAQLIAGRFGGPEEIARQFADVYRAERRGLFHRFLYTRGRGARGGFSFRRRRAGYGGDRDGPYS